MLSEALDKTAITDNRQFFSKKRFQHVIHRKKILKVTKFQFKIIYRSRVLDKNIPLWYILPSPPSPPPPGANTVNINSKVFKIFIIFYSHHKFFVKMFFHNVSTVFAFFDHTINKIVNSIFTYV